MKKGNGKIKRKLNNAGVTLVEILVAMALLVVAIIPLSAGYIYSAQHSVKAKHRQQTSILAHTMIENCKAYSYEKIKEMINDGKFMPNTEVSKHHIDPNVANQYYFDDVKVFGDASTSQKYDLRMTITPITTAKKDIMVYNNMNKYTDAIFNVKTATSSSGVVAKDCDVEAYKSALACVLNDVNKDGSIQPGTFSPLSLSDVDDSLKVGGGGANAGKLEMTRTISIDMNNEGTPVTKQTIEVVYTYSFSFSGKFKYDMLDVNGDPYPDGKKADIAPIPDFDYSFVIYDNTNTYADAKGGAKAKNVYLFYYPSYNNLGMKFAQDIIAINNSLGSNMNVYLMKQAKPVSEMTATELFNEESEYGPNVQYSNSTSNEKVFVYHNLNINMGGGNSTKWAPTYAYPELVWLNFDTTDPDPNKPEALVDNDSKQLMYKVEVAIYPDNAFSYNESANTMSMSGDALASMDGTFLDW